jgi:hypothetical protein
MRRSVLRERKGQHFGRNSARPIQFKITSASLQSSPDAVDVVVIVQGLKELAGFGVLCFRE